MPNSMASYSDEMTAATASALPTVAVNPSVSTVNIRSGTNHITVATHRRRRCPVRVANDSKATEVSPHLVVEKSEADKIVDGMDFGELCNEFECISSPSVEATARQLVRDILELREGNRAIGTYAVSVKYKDPVRSFTGREKYKRPLWSTDALDNPNVSVQDMVMLSTSVLNIKWTLKGNPKNPLASVGGPVILKVNSRFTLNQISGQVIEHEEVWDLSSSSTIAQAYFWASRRLFSTTEFAKDISDSLKNLSSRFSTKKENVDYYPDPSGDPTKPLIDPNYETDVNEVLPQAPEAFSSLPNALRAFVFPNWGRLSKGRLPTRIVSCTTVLSSTVFEDYLVKY